jgi:hypothetical protein
VSDEKALIDIEKPERAGNGPDPETQALRNSKPYCLMKHGDEWLEIQPTIPISPTTLALADPLFEASRPEKDSASQPMLRVLAGILKGVALLLPCRCHGIHQNSRATLARSFPVFDIIACMEDCPCDGLADRECEGRAG